MIMEERTAPSSRTSNSSTNPNNSTSSTSPSVTFPMSFRVASARMDRPYHPPMKLDKENCQQPHGGPFNWMDTDGIPAAVASATVASLSVNKKPSSSSYPTLTPISGAVKTASASPLTPRPSSIPVRPTTTTSNTTTSAVTTQSPVGSLTTPTRMLDQGAVRILNPHASIEKLYRRRVVKCRKRETKNTTNGSSTGGSSRGTNTSSFRSNESSAAWDDSSIMEVDGIPDPHNTSSEQSSVYSLAMELAMDTTPIRSTSSPLGDGGEKQRQEHVGVIRRECINPVALTLWRGGQEDWHDLNSQDRSFLAARTGYFSPSSLSSSRLSVPSPRPVGSDLEDVTMAMTTGTNTASSRRHCEISRPIPTRQVYSPPRHVVPH